jgi:hypothetical protein
VGGDFVGNYLDYANSSILYVCAAVLVAFVMLQSLLFIILAFRSGTKRGLSRQKMFKALRTGVVTSIVPSIAVVVALIAMAPVLGIPVPWMRLSVIGSAPYELMAAGIGAKSMGIDTLGGAGYTKEVFANSVWIMCIGSFWAISIVVLFLKKIKKRYSKVVNKDPKWKNILTSAAFMGVFCIFMADPITTGGLPLITLISGAVFMTIFAVLITKLKINWLKEFALTLSMLGAMASSILFSNMMF